MPQLLMLTSRPEWEVRHGGLLGIKYLLAAWHEAASTLLPPIMPTIKASLQVCIDHKSGRCLLWAAANIGWRHYWQACRHLP